MYIQLLLSEVPLSYLCICLFFRCVYKSVVCTLSVPAPSAMPVITHLLRGLPRTKISASSLLPCQQHQSQLVPISHRPASRRPSLVCLSQQHSRSYQTTSVLCSYILTPPQVNSILKANEYSFKVCGVIHENTSPHISFYLTICMRFGFRCQSLMGRMCHQ